MAVFPKKAAEYLPHKPPMLFIDEIISSGPEGGSVRTELKNDSLLLDKNGIMMREGYVELAAQGYGAIRGYEESLKGRKCGKGFLVAAQNFQIFKDAHPGDTLTVDLRVAGDYEGFYVVIAEIRNKDEVYAQGKIKLFTD